MRRTLLAVFVVFIAAIAGIGIWYWGRTSADASKAEEYAQWVQAQKPLPVEFVITGLPDNTPKDQQLYLSGSAITLGNWQAAGVPLERGDNGTYHARVELMSGMTHGFKVTRGTWGTVEKGEGGADMPNRTVEITEPNKKVEITVASWVDEGKADPTRVSLTGDVRMHPKFKSQTLGNERDLVVYLPPGYDSARDQRYPVLYMQDGQNLMNAATAYAGVEWGVDEAAQRLISEKKIQPIIIVGIYNTEDRTAEFTPAALAGDPAEAKADRYATMLATEIKPFIDERYRTATGTENTAIAGSGLGGVVTLHIAKAQPNFAGKIALLTPFLMIGEKDTVAAMGDVGFLKGKQLWLDMGTEPGRFYPGKTPAADAKRLTAALDQAGLKADQNYRYTQLEGEAHGEAEWAKRIDQVLLYLFPAN
jgi:predicted alpha/beta superfamily hydrolase